WEQFVDFVGSWGTAQIAIRVFLALVVGVGIGFERGVKRRGAGIKTHALVCIGATLTMITGQYIHQNFGGSMEISRIGAQVVSGIGFLGVGTIMVTGRNQVRGLTTAAGLWACACIGLALGIGFIEGALIAFAFVLFTLLILNYIDTILPRYTKIFYFYIEFDSHKDVAKFIQEMRTRNYKISDFELTKSKIKGEGPSATCTVEISKREKGVYALDDLRSMPWIKFIEEI
ncbi:MAG: MgtC/SapB family protein, partial [Spirochaetaceae bacterium]|nr:MgtC/SapB family protein [Spirochaetaceae bacterium]